MALTRIACAPQNFASGRPSGLTVEAIVLHRTGGTFDEIRARFLDSGSATSAHYVVAKDGGVIQFVNEQDTAFHAGLAINPTWKGLKPNTNPNFYTIGVELEGQPTDPVPDAQSEACAALAGEVAARYGIPIDADHIVLHSEIRASRNCPGAPFVRADFLQQTLLCASAAAPFPLHTEVDILQDTNLREGLPSSSVRIVSVLQAGEKVKVSGFTLQGEAVGANSAWYQCEDGDFFWAGNSSMPEPRPAAVAESDAIASPGSAGPDAPPIVPAGPAVPATLGIPDIDQFFSDPSAPAVDLSKASRGAVGTIQDLLTSHGFAKLPSVLSPAYGVCNDATLAALSEFQNNCGLPGDAGLTAKTLQQLVSRPAADPRATQAHFALVLAIPFTGINRLLALTAQMEGVGKFAALNLNTDGAGLSFGLIQWAQKPGRLLDIVAAFKDADTAAFVRLLGAGVQALADRLVAHLKAPFGGVSETSGVTTDPQFDLTASDWAQRFRQAALYTPFQIAQVNKARDAFGNSLARLRQYDTADLVKSERAVAFMLDVANQFGDGHVQKPPTGPDKGTAGLYRSVFRPGMTEQELLAGIADATVAGMPPRFQAGVRARRSLFLTTPLLSTNDEFKPD